MYELDLEKNEFGLNTEAYENAYVAVHENELVMAIATANDGDVNILDDLEDFVIRDEKGNETQVYTGNAVTGARFGRDSYNKYDESQKTGILAGLSKHVLYGIDDVFAEYAQYQKDQRENITVIEAKKEDENAFRNGLKVEGVTGKIDDVTLSQELGNMLVAKYSQNHFFKEYVNDIKNGNSPYGMSSENGKRFGTKTFSKDTVKASELQIDGTNLYEDPEGRIVFDSNGKYKDNNEYQAIEDGKNRLMILYYTDGNEALKKYDLITGALFDENGNVKFVRFEDNFEFEDENRENVYLDVSYNEVYEDFNIEAEEMKKEEYDHKGFFDKMFLNKGNKLLGIKQLFDTYRVKVKEQSKISAVR